MIDKQRLLRITALAFPIIAGMVSQNFLNLIDTAMVGTLGPEALAAVGIGGFATFMSQSLIMGLSTGIQALVSRRKGENKLQETGEILNAGLLLVLVLGTPLMIFLYHLVEPLFPYLNKDSKVIALGVPYLKIRILGTLFVGINFAFRGYWNAIDLSKIYMQTLIATHLINAVLNYVLIFGKFGFSPMGVQGAALGSSIALGCASLTYLIIGIFIARKNGFLKNKVRYRSILSIINISLPNSIQQLFFSSGFTVLYWIIGKVGTTEVAAANITINIMLLAILPAIGFGLASATLVGQSLGNKQPQQAYQWCLDVMKVSSVGFFVIGLIMLGPTTSIIQLFTNDQATISMAIPPLRFTGFLITLDGLGLVLMNSLMGAGDTKRIMYISTSLQWLIFLPLAYVIGPYLGFGLMGIWILQGCYRSLQSLIFWNMWKSKKWASIEL